MYADLHWLITSKRKSLYMVTDLCHNRRYIMPVRYILSSVWMRLSIFSQLSIIQYMGLCIFILPISLLMIERIYTLSYYHHQIGSMNYYPLFRVKSWNNGMRCMPRYSYINKAPVIRILQNLFGTRWWRNCVLFHKKNVSQIFIILANQNPKIWPMQYLYMYIKRLWKFTFI